jgi:hypothetical protein
VVQVSTENGSASGVSVTLTSQPSILKPVFSSGCAKGDGTASCTIGSVTTKQHASLDAKIAVAPSATSVSSVKLTATARVATTAKWTPPAAAETTSVTPASGVQSSASAGGAHLAVLPLGPIPNLNGAASVLIGAGNAADLFPAITASSGPGADPSADPQPGGQNTAPVSDASPVSADTPVFTAQVAGLIALGLAIVLTVTRLAVRKRSRPSGPRS